MLPMTSLSPPFLVVPAPEEETLVSSALSELVYGLPRADDAVFSSQMTADLLRRPLLIQFLFHSDGEKGAQSHLQALLLGSPTSGIRLVFRFPCVIRSVHTVPSDFSCDSVDASSQKLSDTAYT